MEYRIGKQTLLDTISIWDGFFKRKAHLIACGGTALTLLGVKATTKDVDLIVPDEAEYHYLTNILKQLGYKAVSSAGWRRGDGFIFDIYRDKHVHTTELLESPLNQGNHFLLKEFNHIYLGILNYYDTMISKLFRGDGIDIEDCLSLIKAKRDEIDIKNFINRFKETTSFDVSEDKVNKNLEHFLKILEREGIYGSK